MFQKMKILVTSYFLRSRKVKRFGDSSVVEHLLNLHVTLNLILSTAKKYKTMKLKFKISKE